MDLFKKSSGETMIAWPASYSPDGADGEVHLLRPGRGGRTACGIKADHKWSWEIIRAEQLANHVTCENCERAMNPEHGPKRSAEGPLAAPAAGPKQ